MILGRSLSIEPTEFVFPFHKKKKKKHVSYIIVVLLMNRIVTRLKGNKIYEKCHTEVSYYLRMQLSMGTGFIYFLCFKISINKYGI